MQRPVRLVVLSNPGMRTQKQVYRPHYLHPPSTHRVHAAAPTPPPQVFHLLNFLVCGLRSGVFAFRYQVQELPYAVVQAGLLDLPGERGCRVWWGWHCSGPRGGAGKLLGAGCIICTNFRLASCAMLPARLLAHAMAYPLAAIHSPTPPHPLCPPPQQACCSSPPTPCWCCSGRRFTTRPARCPPARCAPRLWS